MRMANRRLCCATHKLVSNENREMIAAKQLPTAANWFAVNSDINSLIDQ